MNQCLPSRVVEEGTVESGDGIGNLNNSGLFLLREAEFVVTVLNDVEVSLDWGKLFASIDEIFKKGEGFFDVGVGESPS